MIWILWAVYGLGAVTSFRILVLLNVPRIGKRYNTVIDGTQKKYNWLTARIWSSVTFGTVLWPILLAGFVFWKLAFPFGLHGKERRQARRERKIFLLREQEDREQATIRDAEAIIREWDTLTQGQRQGRNDGQR
jgi:hypothetical protein